jgi:hypothetical protein
MKKLIHRAEERGHANHGWLDTYHSFSFANWYDPRKVHFGNLRVLNDDYIAGGKGFGTHPHDNMEIVTIVLEGKLEHADSTGNRKQLVPGEVQIMSAGTGLMHSEYNASPTEHVQLLQLWVFPKQKNIKPRYDQKMFSEEGKKNKFQVVVAPDVDDALWINQDAYFSLLDTTEEQTMTYKTHKPGNGVYFFVIDGDFSIADEQLHRRDAIGVSEAEEIEIKTPASGKLLAIEVPMVA